MVFQFSGFLPVLLSLFHRHLSLEHHQGINKYYIRRINDWNFDFFGRALPLGLNSCKPLFPLEATESLDPLPPIPRLISWQYQILNPRSTSSTHHLDICIMDNFDLVCQYLNWFDYRPSRKLFCKHAVHTTWYIVCTILEMGSTVTIVPYVNFLWHCFYRNRYVEKKNHVLEYSGISSSKSQLF